MNYKFSDNLSSKYVVLSYFQRGLFWGTIFSWMAVMSGFSGAVIAKVFYLDQRKTVIVENYSVPQNSQLLISQSFDNVRTKDNSSLTTINWQSIKSNSEELTISLAGNFLLSPNYQLVSNVNISFPDSTSFATFAAAFPHLSRFSMLP